MSYFLNRPCTEPARRDFGLVAMPQQIVHETFGLNLAAVENRYPVADVFHIGQQVTAQKNRLAPPGKLDYEVFDLSGPYRIEPRSRLVQYQQIRIVYQSLRQTYSPGHTL